MIKAMLSFLLISGFAATAAEKTPLEKAAEFYNSLSRDEALTVLRSQSNEGDAAYMDMLRSQIPSEKLPVARAQGNKFYLQGLDKPIVAEDLAKGIFSYSGRRFVLDFTKDFRTNAQILEGQFRLEQYAWMNWILPQAHASFDFGSLLLGGAIVGGIGMAWKGEDTTTKMLGTGIAVAGGMGALWKYFDNKKEKDEKRRWWKQQQLAGYQGPPPAPAYYGLPAYYRAPAAATTPVAAAIPMTATPMTVQTVTPGAVAGQ